MCDDNCFTEAYKGLMEKVFEGEGNIIDAKWSESIAIGSKFFAENVEEKPGIRVIGRNKGRI